MVFTTASSYLEAELELYLVMLWGGFVIGLGLGEEKLMPQIVSVVAWTGLVVVAGCELLAAVLG